MITVIALILQVLMSLVTPTNNAEVIVIPPMPQHSPAVAEENEWLGFKVDAYWDYADEFTALFNSYDVKRAKNGALMIRRGNSGSYRFTKKG